MVRSIADCIRVVALSAGLSLGLAATGAGCSNSPSKEQCEALLDHVVDLEIKEVGADKNQSADAREDLEKQRKELKGYVQEQFIKRCLDSLPAEFVACGMKAASKADYAECERQ